MWTAGHGALNVMLCPLDPFSSRGQHSSAILTGHCMVPPLLQGAAGLMRKGAQAREGLLENQERRKRKLLPPKERGAVRRERQDQ